MGILKNGKKAIKCPEFPPLKKDLIFSIKVKILGLLVTVFGQSVRGIFGVKLS